MKKETIFDIIDIIFLAAVSAALGIAAFGIIYAVNVIPGFY